jgi:hypothetical protein
MKMKEEEITYDKSYARACMGIEVKTFSSVSLHLLTCDYH